MMSLNQQKSFTLVAFAALVPLWSLITTEWNLEIEAGTRFVCSLKLLAEARESRIKIIHGVKNAFEAFLSIELTNPQIIRRPYASLIHFPWLLCQKHKFAD